MNYSAIDVVGCGSCGNVIKVNDIAYKKYFDDCFSNRIDSEVFDKLKTVDSDCFVHLLDRKMIDLYGRKVVDSYTYKYINDIKELMIDLPMEYTLETLNNFKVLLEKLNKMNIAIFDASEDNVLVTNNGLVIIDPDLYSFDKSEDKKGLATSNREYILQYIIELWKEEYIQKHRLSRSKKTYKTLETLDYYFDDCTDIKEKLTTKNPDELINKLVKKRSL